MVVHLLMPVAQTVGGHITQNIYETLLELENLEIWLRRFSKTRISPPPIAVQEILLLHCFREGIRLERVTRVKWPAQRIRNIGFPINHQLFSEKWTLGLSSGQRSTIISFHNYTRGNSLSLSPFSHSLTFFTKSFKSVFKSFSRYFDNSACKHVIWNNEQKIIIFCTTSDCLINAGCPWHGHCVFGITFVYLAGSDGLSWERVTVSQLREGFSTVRGISVLLLLLQFFYYF